MDKRGNKWYWWLGAILLIIWAIASAIVSLIREPNISNSGIVYEIFYTLDFSIYPLTLLMVWGLDPYVKKLARLKSFDVVPTI